MRLFPVFGSLVGAAAIYTACSVVSTARQPLPTADAQTSIGGSRLKARYLLAEDGSRQFLGWYDSQRQENCAFTQAPDDIVRCMPFVAAAVAHPFSQAFADSACTRRIEQRQAVPALCQTEPMFLFESGGSTCAPRLRFYQFGDPFTGTYYVQAAGRCVQADAPSPDMFYVGPEVPTAFWAAYVAATERHD